ncbi:hypothetical protein HIM_09685 [Hirsutella minnesotensis 3608]|uniref:Amine oxidase domain-containing protein n=1 Tax=Hirsutella minnesotensis 3608 TaxID=1043627 RepID=A0A0F8A2Z4_9HYPO|nr:hypothetical protein HIM_09685 [Hirsutella minnesotensis 3608]
MNNLRNFSVRRGASALAVFGFLTTAYAQPPPTVAREVDVCVIGGGSSGTYAAIKLHDAGLSVAVVERENTLGGHVNTYIDPNSKRAIDYGVVAFHSTPLVKSYFERLDIPYEQDSSFSSTTYINLENGQRVDNYTSPNPTAALAKYASILSRWPFLDEGFELPDPVPEDLFQPFGDFVQKHGIEDAVEIIYSFAQGLGDVLRQPTLYVLKSFGSQVLASIKTGFLSTARKNNHEIYEKALEILQANVFLNSRILNVRRTPGALTEIVFDTPSGRTVIQAKRLLVTIPPTIQNLGVFDLDEAEKTLFNKFTNAGYYTGLVRGTGLHNISTIMNVNPSLPYNLPRLPALYFFQPTPIEGLYGIKYGTPSGLDEAWIKDDIIKTIKRLNGPNSSDTAGNQAELVEFASHTPFELKVQAKDIKENFYKKLYSLQSHRDTYYSGAAFHTHDSSLLWQFTAGIVDRLIESIRV